MRKERKLSFCLADNVLADRFISRSRKLAIGKRQRRQSLTGRTSLSRTNKFGMTVMLLAAPFMFCEIGEASAQCTTTPSCSSMGYTSGVNTGNCLKCPTGNGWFCPPKSNTCTSNCPDYTLTYDQAQVQCGSGNFTGCFDNCTAQKLFKCTTISCQTKKRTIYGKCQMQYLVGYAIFCQRGYYYCKVQSSGNCIEITGSRIYDNELTDFGAYPNQTEANQRIKQLENTVIDESCETYNGNGGSSSGGSSGGTTPTVCKIRTFAKYENCKWQAISDLSGNIMCQRCTYKEQRQSKNSTQWNQISRQCNSNFEKENFISVTDKEALNSYVQTVLQKDEGSEISGSSSCIEYY